MTDYELFLKENKGYIKKQAKLTEKSDLINNALYEKYDVKRGLRDINGNGVVCGLTEISEINAFRRNEKGEKVPCDGEMYYRGIEINSLIDGFQRENRFGFEEVCYLLLFGKQPTIDELAKFNEVLNGLRSLPKNFVRDVIMKAPSTDMMNMLARSVLTIYSYDENPDDITLPNILRQVIGLLAQFPPMAVYGYNAFKYYKGGESLHIHKPLENYSTAQNILHMLRADSSFTELEAKILDLCLILHAEHGGGNNSSFAMRVISSSGTDTYSAVSASLASLKGGRHGGANVKVVKMIADMKANIKTASDGDISDYIDKLLDGEAFDKLGVVYGMGHAVYSVSDPRAVILKKFVKDLAISKGKEEEFDFYQKVERIAPEVIAEKRKIYKGVPINVDFYSGLVYQLLGIPQELYTPLFAISRMAGWGSHRLEEMANKGKIIRPAYIAVGKRQEYTPINER
ncbi:MAG: citrate/2-methylcitrate synthase [Clostridia bacterium]